MKTGKLKILKSVLWFIVAAALIAVFLEIWFSACEMVSGGNFFLKIVGYFIFICESVMTIFMVVVIVSFIAGLWPKEDKNSKK